MPERPDESQALEVGLAPQSIKQKYAAAYRSIAVDGAVVTLNTGGDIFLAFYSEHSNLEGRLPILRDGDGFKQGPIERDSQLLREIEVGMFIPIPVAIELHNLLNTKLNEAIGLWQTRQGNEQESTEFSSDVNH